MLAVFLGLFVVRESVPKDWNMNLKFIETVRLLGTGEIMLQQIKPCRVCKRIPVLKKDWENFPIEPYSVKCECGLETIGATAKEAIERWNGRDK